jgi:hypothetical protein
VRREGIYTQVPQVKPVYRRMHHRIKVCNLAFIFLSSPAKSITAFFL